MKLAPKIWLALLLVAAVTVSACSPAVTPSPTPAPVASATPFRAAEPTPVPTATATTAPAQPPPTAATATTLPTVTAAAAPTRAPTALPAPTAGATPSPAPAALKVDIFVSGLDTPWAIDFAPDGRVFISERPGRIRVIKEGKLQPEPWATLPVNEVGEAGLLGLALDPQFAQNHFLYTAYTYRSAQGGLLNRLVRLREDPATGKGVLDRVLFDEVQANSTHDGGRVKFGPDGKLYWSIGDAQNTAAAQDPKLPIGKILRLNADGTIPADNSFPGLPVYSYGHRNVQGLAWQPGTGRLFATEHGPSGGQGCCQDEVNLIEPGKNYGWPLITGDRKQEGLVSPIIHSGVTETWAPGGATFVTRGPWQGALLFTGLRGQTLYRITLDPNNPATVTKLDQLLVQQYGRLRDVAEGPDGALYVLTSNGDGRGNLPPDGDRVLRLTFGS